MVTTRKRAASSISSTESFASAVSETGPQSKSPKLSNASQSHNSPVATTSGSANLAPSAVAAMVQELDLEIDARCEALRAFASTLKLALRTQLQLELMKLPKRIKMMKMKDYLQEHGGLAQNVLMSAKKPSSASNAFVMQTPARPTIQKTNNNDTSVLWSGGKVLLSAQKQAIVVEVGGKEVDLSDAGKLKSMSVADRKLAGERLKQLTAEMESLMAEMEGM